MIKSDPKALAAAVTAARAAIDNMSALYSSMIDDETLESIVNEAVTAYLNPTPKEPTT